MRIDSLETLSGVLESLGQGALTTFIKPIGASLTNRAFRPKRVIAILNQFKNFDAELYRHIRQHRYQCYRRTKKPAGTGVPAGLLNSSLKLCQNRLGFFRFHHASTSDETTSTEAKSGPNGDG